MAKPRNPIGFRRWAVHNDFDYLIYNHDIETTSNIVSYIVSEEISKWINKEDNNG